MDELVIFGHMTYIYDMAFETQAIEKQHLSGFPGGICFFISRKRSTQVGLAGFGSTQHPTSFGFLKGHPSRCV